MIDPGVLEIENIERHLLGKFWIGKPKVEGVKAWLVDHGMDGTRITTHVDSVQTALGFHQDADLVISAIDTRRDRDAVNEWCFSFNKPAIYCGIYPKGVGGHVFVVPHPHDACYMCAELVMGGQYEEKLPLSYGIELSPDFSTFVVPALSWAIHSLSADTVGFALAYLQQHDVEPQIYIKIHTPWQDVLYFCDKQTTAAMNGYVELQKTMGLINTVRMIESNGEHALQIRRSTIALRLEQSQVCPFHSRAISLDNI